MFLKGVITNITNLKPVLGMKDDFTSGINNNWPMRRKLPLQYNQIYVSKYDIYTY